jgi:hypothetical protein
MKLVKNIFQIPRRMWTEGDLGIEIEVEGVSLPAPVGPWIREEDGSLRGQESAEYVLSEPCSLAGVGSALSLLEEAYHHNNTKVDDTVRAGVHVHVNAQDLTIPQLGNFLCLYLILEDALVQLCGEGRQGNLFCLRTKDAAGGLAKIVQSFSRGRWEAFGQDDLRYSSYNVKALATYGSLEFRAMRGTRDLSKIYDWAKLLLGLREKAKTYHSPVEIIKGYSDGELSGFLRHVLGEEAKTLLAMPDIGKLVKDGMRRAQDLAFLVDWEYYYKPQLKLVGDLWFPEDMIVINEPLEDY